MSEKSLTLSSSGLKNLVLNEEKFVFHFGEQALTTNRIFAEFLCPAVSRLHQSDPTIQDIYYKNHINLSSNSETPSFSTIFTSSMISKLSELSCGNSIKITQEESEKIRIISIILENDDLFNIINSLYPIDMTEIGSNIDYCLHIIEYYEYFQKKQNKLNLKDIVDQIASQFYKIDQKRLKNLPLQIVYDIISSEKLKLESEDSLLDFINELFSEKVEDDENELKLIDFYEHIEFSQLTEEKLDEFLDEFNINQITATIWQKLKKCIHTKKDQKNENRYTKNKEEKKNESRYTKNNNAVKIEYDVNNPLRGIIFNLTNEKGGNVSDKDEVIITSSSILSNSYLPKYAADFDDQNFFHSKSEPTSWLMYDFKERKICPTHYSMKNASDSNSSPRSWVFEASNTGNEGDWTALDTQNGTTFFMHINSVTHTFNIEKAQNNEYYRYIRIRTTDKNNNGYTYFAISIVEFFGFIEQPK